MIQPMSRKALRPRPRPRETQIAFLYGIEQSGEGEAREM